MKHTIQFTASIQKGENDWLVGQLQEMPEVISQGRTIEELKENLLDALQLVLEFRKEAAGKQPNPDAFMMETLELTL